jgi:hypothetical protein
MTATASLATVPVMPLAPVAQMLVSCPGISADAQNSKTGCGFEDPNVAATLCAAAAQQQRQGF